MNKILSEIKSTMLECVEKYLTDISLENLEDNGDIFYMNGKNGTEFDWFVNDHLSDFMMFYNDKDNMGAVKATLYNDGGLLIYVYGERGKSIVKETEIEISAELEDILSLAALLKNEMDDKNVFDKSITLLAAAPDPDSDKINQFLSAANYFAEMRERKIMLGQIAFVSKKITEEGWKVGYMYRDEPNHEQDSGWVLMAGNEDDEYTEDSHNLQVMSVHSVMQFDDTVWKYITAPVGTRLIRISETEFEPDDNTKEIFMYKG